MPVDLEMILSASPPIFSSSAFMDFRYNPFNGSHEHRLGVPRFGFGHQSDMRPCLAMKSDDAQNIRDGKKRVWFADDKGLALTKVKIISEPSNCPPRWTDDFVQHITKGLIKPHPASDVNWEPSFPQPASNYLEFRSKLQKNCVSLENVIVREGDDNVTGTIKVKNISFDKEVFVRLTFDKWHTSQDVPATYLQNGVEGTSSTYDTFSFSAAIPSLALKYESIEFCVCFKCSGSEYWDNNDGMNYKLYVLRKKSSPQQIQESKFNDALKVNLDSWSEFASWSHLINEGPYW